MCIGQQKKTIWKIFFSECEANVGQIIVKSEPGGGTPDSLHLYLGPYGFGQRSYALGEGFQLALDAHQQVNANGHREAEIAYQSDHFFQCYHLLAPLWQNFYLIAQFNNKIVPAPGIKDN